MKLAAATALAVAAGCAGEEPSHELIAFTRAGVVYAVAEDGSRERRLTVGKDPQWSHDRRQLVFERPGAIWTVSANGTGPRRLVSGIVQDPTWSQRGDLAFSAPLEGGHSAVFVRSPQGRVSRITGGGEDFHADWSPDGNSLSFDRVPDEPPGVYVAAADGTGERRLGDGMYPAWSPDGSEILFAWCDRPCEPGFAAWDAWLMAADGTGRQRIARLRFAEFRGDWSPDGERIIVSDGADLFVMDTDGSDRRHVTRGADPDWAS